jgi:uncharacterized membrane protein
VAGDAMDLALLGASFISNGNRRERLAAALSAVGGVTVADLRSARQTSRAVGDEDTGGIQRLVKAITIRRQPQDVYRFWRDFRNFPSFVSHVGSVAVLDDRHSHWTVRGPAGRSVEWDAEITEDQPNEMIARRSLPGADVGNSGRVQFAPAPGDCGSEVRVEMHYSPPGGELGAAVARLLGQEPRQQVQADLRKLTQVLETGEVVRSEATLHGTHIFQAPAQPRQPTNGRSPSMRAACWIGKTNVQVQDVSDSRILNARDAIVKISSTAICGSDLHLYNGFVHSMKRGDILGHEFMGEVVEIGSGVKKLKVGDRVVVPFPIACGACSMCDRNLFSVCENSNPNAWMPEKLWGQSPAGIFGYSHMLGGFAGGQAQYARVPFADVGPLKIENGLSDEQVLFLSDIFPTGYMGADLCEIKPGDTIAVWAAVPSASSRSRARACWAPNASSPSTVSRTACAGRVSERVPRTRPITKKPI